MFKGIGNSAKVLDNVRVCLEMSEVVKTVGNIQNEQA